MPIPSSSLVEQIYRMAGVYRDDTSSDAELLSRYAEFHEESAFSALMVRHGAVVWSICRRILGNTQDVEEAYQNTFLTFACKAKKIRSDTLVGWLHQVAYQTALSARRKVKSRQRQCEELETTSDFESMAQMDDAEIYENLHGQIAKLPENLRIALVLHYLEGRTQADIARILGITKAAVWQRIHRAKAILKNLLKQRGLTMGMATLSSFLVKAACNAAASLALVNKTLRAATAFRAGTLAVKTNELAQGILKQAPAKMWWKSGWLILAACVTGLSLGTGGIAWRAGFLRIKPQKPARIADQAAIQSSRPSPPKADLYGDPLPEGAQARIGTKRFRFESVSMAMFLHGGKTIAALSSEPRPQVVVWEAATGKEIRHLQLRDDHYFSMCVLDSGQIALDGRRGVELWDFNREPPLQVWQNVKPLGKYTKLFHGQAIQFAPDGRTIALAGFDEMDKLLVIILDAATGKMRRELLEIGHIVGFSPDGKTLAASNGLWDTKTWQRRRLNRKDESGNLHYLDIPFVFTDNVVFSPDGKFLAAVALPAGWKGPRICSLWDVATGAEIRQIWSIAGSTGEGPMRTAFFADGRTLVGADAQGRFHFWDVSTRKPNAPTVNAERVLGGRKAFHGCEGTCFSPDRGRLLTWKAGHSIVIWDVKTGRLDASISTLGGIHGSIWDLNFSPDGVRLATLASREIQIWDSETGRPGQSLELNCKIDVLPPLDYSSNNRLTAWIYNTAQAVHWDVRTGKADVQRPPSAESGAPRCTSSNGELQLWVSEKRISLVDRSTQKVVQHFPAVGNKRKFVGLSADGETVLVEDSMMQDSPVFHVYSVRTRRELMILDQKESWVRDFHLRTSEVALSPDGRRLAEFRQKSKFEQKPVVGIWDLASGGSSVDLTFPNNVRVCRLLWAPNGRLLAGGDDEGSVWIWDLGSLQNIHRFTGHRSAVLAMAFSPDGLRLASGCADATALIWDLRALKYRPALAPQSVTPNDLWDALQKSHHVEKAWAAMDYLVQNPNTALPLLRRLKPVAVIDSARIQTLLNQLEDKQFRVRKRAREELEEMDRRIAPTLRRALAKGLSVEAGRCVRVALEKIESSGLSTKEVQACRGVEVLERICTPQARRLLEELAEEEGGVQAVEARCALQRLAQSRNAAAAK